MFAAGLAGCTSAQALKHYINHIREKMIFNAIMRLMVCRAKLVRVPGLPFDLNPYSLLFVALSPM
jgi:hypothetical protein